MRYCVENRLDMFEFHDAEFLLTNYDGTDLTVSAKHLNIHKATLHNPSDCDMEIECAKISFQGFHSPSYEPGRTWKKGEDGEYYPVGPHVIFSGKEAEEKILEALQDQITVYDFSKKDDGSYYVDGIGNEPFFTMGFCFDKVIIEWDTYRKKAWYELHRQYRYDITLSTPDGDEQAALTVICHDEAVYYKGVLEKAPIVTVGCQYDGKALWGRGSDDLWIDAFADLQKQLPDGVSMKCCLTCRYGNSCPEGDAFNHVVCTRDEGKREDRIKQCFHMCEDYQP